MADGVKNEGIEVLSLNVFQLLGHRKGEVVHFLRGVDSLHQIRVPVHLVQDFSLVSTDHLLVVFFEFCGGSCAWLLFWLILLFLVSFVRPDFRVFL